MPSNISPSLPVTAATGGASSSKSKAGSLLKFVAFVAAVSLMIVGLAQMAPAGATDRMVSSSGASTARRSSAGSNSAGSHGSNRQLILSGPGVADGSLEDAISYLKAGKGSIYDAEAKTPQIHYQQLLDAPLEQTISLFSSWLFQPLLAEGCSNWWVPNNGQDSKASVEESYKHGRQAWPLCQQVPVPGPSRCFMYSAGLRDGFSFEFGAMRDVSCNVRIFDGWEEDRGIQIPGLPQAMIYHGVRLAGDNRPHGEPIEGTLSTLHSLEKEQGRRIHALKVDGGLSAGLAFPNPDQKRKEVTVESIRDSFQGGRDWEAYSQLLTDVGPKALQTYDHLLLRLNLSSVASDVAIDRCTAEGEGSSVEAKKRHAAAMLASIAALSLGSGFRVYWRRPFPYPSAVRGSLGEMILQKAQEHYGSSSYAKTILEATSASLGDLSTHCKTFSSVSDSFLPPLKCDFDPLFDVKLGQLVSTWDIALVRTAAVAVGGKVETRYAKDAGCFEGKKKKAEL